MDAVAFIDPAVVDFINANLIPIRVPADDPELGPRYKVKWTPTLLIVDADGVEQSRTLGFYPPAELIPSLLAASDVLGTGWFAAVAAEVGPGKTVVVVGDGAVGLLAIYDMCKSIDRGMRIESIQLEEKRGGKSGVWQRNPMTEKNTG